MSEDYEENRIEIEEVDENKSRSKFTDWKNEPTVTKLKEDLTSAQSEHSIQKSKISTWLDNLYVQNSAKPKAKANRSSVQPKIIRKQAEWRYSALSEPFLSTEDVFNVSPVTFEDKKAAEQNELVLNYQFNNQLNKIKFIGEYIRTAVNEGTVIVRIGWDSEEEEYTEIENLYEYVVSINPTDMEKVNLLLQQSQNDPIGFKLNVPEEWKEALKLSLERQQIVVPRIAGTQEVTKTKVLKNQPTLEVCDYRNVLIDPTCEGDLDNAQFIIYSMETSKAELERDGRYSNLDDIDVTANSILSAPDHAIEGENSSFNFTDDAKKKIVAYEYWGYHDINNDGLLKPIVATWVGDTLIRLEENPFPDGKLPFVAASYLPVKKSIYGEPDGELLADNQKIIGATTRAMIDLLGRSANAQQGMRKDALDLPNRRKFDKGEDYEFNPGVNPRDMVHMHTFPEIPQSAGIMLELQNNDAESLTGVKAFSSGLSGQALGNTATGIRSALDATSKRELDILNRLAEGIKEIGNKIISMNSEFLSEEEVIRVTNENFVKVKREDLVGRFHLKLTISTAEADNQKAQELVFMLQTMGNNIDVGLSKIILEDIAKLRKMPELAKRISEFEPQPNPLEQEKQMLEIELLKAQIANEQSKAIENQTDAQLNTAKARTELSKSRNLESDSDLKDLDFIEQESGTKQERDLQSIRTQAEAQTGMKVVEQGLKDSVSNQKDTGTSNGLETI